jgi:Antibiotic biosynthesis monooxygenase
MAYVIIVEFRAKPDKVEAFAALIDRHAHNSRTLEDGCLAFDVCQDPDDPARFVFYEAYRDQEAYRELSRWTASSGSGPRPRTWWCRAPRARCRTTARC